MRLGTLGSGNHFIEVCLDEQGAVWLMLHSGSRGVGNAIGSMFIALAREDALRQQANLPDRDLAYFEGGSRHFGEDVYVTRKGAVSAKGGQLGIIPGSMGARSYIDVVHTLKRVVCVKG